MAGLLAAPLAADAQPAGKTAKVGILSPASPSEAGRGPSDLAVLFAAFRDGLRELGYVDGQNVRYESRFAEGHYDRLPALAADLVRLKVDVIVTYGTPASQAAKRATTTLPVVMAAIIDPVASGPGNAPQVRHGQDAARALGVRLQILAARTPGEIDAAFTAMTAEQASAVVVLVDAMLQDNRTRITELAARHRLPAVYGLSEYVEVGGLLAYGPSRLEMFRRAASYVDKILKGAKPGDLPVEQPNRFALAVNLKTARTLGLTLPPALLLRADQVIE